MPSPQHRTLGIGRSSLFLILYVVVYGFLARDWLGQAYVKLPRDLHTDGWFIYWVFGWVGDTLLTAPGSVFDPPINWPATNQLAGSEHFGAWQILYLPLRTLLGSEMAAMNGTIFLSYVFAAWAASLLLLQLGCSTAVGWICGLLYGATDVAFGSAALPHGLQVSNLFLPWTILCLVRIRDAPTWRAGLHLTVALIVGFLSSYYMAVLLVFLASMWGLFDLIRAAPDRGRYLLVTVPSALAAAGVVVFLSLPYFDRPEVAGDPDRVVSMWQVGHLVGETAVDEQVGLHKNRPAEPSAEKPDPDERWGATWELRKVALIRSLPLVRALLVIVALVSLARSRCPLPRATVGGLVLLLGGAFVSMPELLPWGDGSVETPVAYLLRRSPARFVRQTMRLAPIWLLGSVVLTAVGLEVVRSWKAGLPFAALLLFLLATEFDRRLDPATTNFLRASDHQHAPQKLLRRHYGTLTPLPDFFRPVMETNAALADDADAYERMAKIIHENGPGPILEVPTDLARASSTVGQRVLGVPSIYFYSGYVPPHTLLIQALAADLPAPEPLEDLVGLTGLRWLIIRLDSPRGKKLAHGFRHGIGLDKVVERKWNLPGQFLLVQLSQRRRNQHWIDALRKGPEAGTSLLGYPRTPISGDEVDYQVRLTAAIPPLTGWATPYVISVLNPGPPLPAARPDRPEEPLSVRLRLEWLPHEDGLEVPEPKVVPLRRDIGPSGYLVQRENILNPPVPGIYKLTARLEQIGNDGFVSAAPETIPYRVGSVQVVVTELDAPSAPPAAP